jgi:hypothetical protein
VGEHASLLFDVDDECVTLLLEHGARGFNSNSPVLARIIRDLARMVRSATWMPCACCSSTRLLTQQP